MQKSDFITIPIRLWLADHVNMGLGEPESVDDVLRLRPERLGAYRRDPSTEDNPGEAVMFYVDGHEYFTPISLEEFEQLVFKGGA